MAHNVDDKTDKSAALATDPGGFLVSNAKLRILCPNLCGLRGILHSIKVALGLEYPLRSHIEQQLKLGDARAAVVLTRSPLQVAAYSDEFDGVVMLKFPDSVAEQYLLPEGSRLLTVNFYRSTGSLDQDLICGPEASRNWTNFTPMIAEFLTDETERIEAHKRRIDEREWQRALALGQAYLNQFPGVARDGRPGFSSIPAGRSGATGQAKPHIAAMLTCLLFCLACIAVEFYTVGLFRKSLQIESWPTTVGIVRRSEVKPRELGQIWHTATIEYDYSINEKPYRSSNIRPRGTSSKDVTGAVTVVNRFPVNANVDVFYNVNNPAESFLIPGVDQVDYLIIVLPLLLGLLFGWGFIDHLLKRLTHK